MYHASDMRVRTHTHAGCSGYGGNGGYGKGRAAGVHRSETAMWQGSWFVGVLGPTSGAFHLCVKCRSIGCGLPSLARMAPFWFLCVLPSVARIRPSCLASSVDKHLAFSVSPSEPTSLAHVHTSFIFARASVAECPLSLPLSCPPLGWASLVLLPPCHTQ